MSRKLIKKIFGRLKEKVDDKSKKSFLKGFGYLINQDYDKALDELKEVVKNNTHMIEMYVALGSLFRTRGEYLKAIHIHESAVGEKDLKKDIKKQVLHELVLDYKLMGQYDKAIYYLNELLLMDKSPVLYKMMGELLFDKGEYEKAIKYYTKYEKLSKKSASREIAYCFFKLAEKASEIKDKLKLLKKSLQRFPVFRMAHYALLDIHLRQKKVKHIFSAVRDIIEKDVFFQKDDILKVSSIYYDHGKLDEFVSLCINKVSKKNENPFYYIFLADYFEKQGEEEKAEEILKNYLKDVRPLKLVVREYLKLRKDDILQELFSAKMYKCEKCKEEFEDFYDICPNCRKVQSFQFN